MDKAVFLRYKRDSCERKWIKKNETSEVAHRMYRQEDHELCHNEEVLTQNEQGYLLVDVPIIDASDVPGKIFPSMATESVRLLI